MTKGDIMRNIAILNTNIPPVFQLMLEDKTVVLYQKKSTGIVNKNGGDIPKLKKLGVMIEADYDKIGVYLTGYFDLIKMSLAFKDSIAESQRSRTTFDKVKKEKAN